MRLGSCARARRAPPHAKKFPPTTNPRVLCLYCVRRQDWVFFVGGGGREEVAQVVVYLSPEHVNRCDAFLMCRL